MIFTKLFYFSIVNFWLKCAAWQACKEDICFYFNGTLSSNITEAQEFCKQNGSHLLELYNASVVEIFESFMPTIPFININSYSHIWLNLMRSNFDWKWVNDDKFIGLKNVPFSNSSEQYNYSYLNHYYNQFSIFSNGPFPVRNFMCSTRDCTSSSCVSIHGGTTLDWFTARYECLKIDKDLAVLNWVTNISNDLPELLQYNTGTFWIGLYRQQYRWKESNFILGYNKWLGTDGYNYVIPGECTLLNIQTLMWTSTICNLPPMFTVCMTGPIFEPKIYTSKISQDLALKIGLGVGIPSLLIIIGLVVCCYCCCCKNRNENTSEDGSQNTDKGPRQSNDTKASDTLTSGSEDNVGAKTSNANKSNAVRNNHPVPDTRHDNIELRILPTNPSVGEAEQRQSDGIEYMKITN